MRSRADGARRRDRNGHRLAPGLMTVLRPRLEDIGLIGNRRTAAAVGSDATVCWFSPHRFDGPSLFNGLLDPQKGMWRVSLPGAVPRSRRYIGDSAVLETRLAHTDAVFVVTDWMTIGDDAPAGLLCRSFSQAPDDVTISFEAWSDYGCCPALPAMVDGVAVFEDGCHLFASHPLERDGRAVRWRLPRGEAGWTVLADAPRRRPSAEDLATWRSTTIERWHALAETTSYAGPYREQAEVSLRQLRLLIFEPTGAVVAAPTAGLPEVIGGRRNYDYRYSWLRDTAMVVRALLRTAARTAEAEEFLAFAAASRRCTRGAPLDAVVTIDGYPVPEERNPPLAGYDGSRPVRIGNRAGKQLQLGALGIFLLAAGMIYRERHACPHWDVAREVADFLVAHWREPDSGIWELPAKRQYTESKVFAACGLEAVAPFADKLRQERYRAAAQAIRRHVMRRCLTSEGAFAAFEGGRGVDVSAALFPAWGFCAPDAPEMDATMRRLHRTTSVAAASSSERTIRSRARSRARFFPPASGLRSTGRCAAIGHAPAITSRRAWRMRTISDSCPKRSIGGQGEPSATRRSP